MTKVSFYELQQKRPISNLGLNPFPWYKQMRMTNPVSIDEQDSLCEVFRYKDVQAVLADSTHISVKGRFGEDGTEQGSIANMDPPRHKKLRTLVSQAFTPRAIVDLADNIRTIANELLDACATSDRLELIHDFAIPFPMRVIAGMLGVPLARQDDFKRWSQGIVGHSQEEAVACF
jgi:cytochrome P450 family 109